jgi:hypothetical protein
MCEKIAASCPACGVEPGDHDGGLPCLHLANIRTGARQVAVICTNCGLQWSPARTEEDAIAAWNRRAPDPRIEKAREALAKIAEGAGPYSRDPLTHAANTIDAMKALAVKALATLEVE